MSELIDRTARMRAKRDIFAMQNANVTLDIARFKVRNDLEAVSILKSFQKPLLRKIARLERRIKRIETKFANKGQHVLDPRKKEKN